MADRTIIIGLNEARCFAPKTRTQHRLFVRNVDGKLRFSAADDVIRYIAGRQMAKKVRNANAEGADPPATELVDGETLWLTVPEHAETVFVYIEERNGWFNLVSGSAIIDCIAGNGLFGRVEPDSQIEA